MRQINEVRCIDAKQRFPFRQRSHYELRLNAVAVLFIGLQRYRAIAHAGSKQKGRVTRSVAFLRCSAHPRQSEPSRTTSSVERVPNRNDDAAPRLSGRKTPQRISWRVVAHPDIVCAAGTDPRFRSKNRKWQRCKPPFRKCRRDPGPEQFCSWRINESGQIEFGCRGRRGVGSHVHDYYSLR